jgi:hypothetical protein
MTAQFDALAHYQAQIEQAQDRVRLFEAKTMSYGDAWPPKEAIDRDKLLIENYQQMIDRL